MIQAENVSLIIKKKPILHDINVSFERGRIHGLVGRNGSGKTVFMKCICGFMQPTKGQITVNGKIIGKDCDFPDNTGVIIENPTFVRYYSGFRNLKLLAGINRKIDDEDIRRVLCQVGLDPENRLSVGKYSLGMRQRLGLAQALMEDPELLILDEPFNGLDEDGVEDIRALLLELKEQKKTIILSSHNREDIDVLCDKVYRLYKGEMEEIR